MLDKLQLNADVKVAPVAVIVRRIPILTAFSACKRQTFALGILGTSSHPEAAQLSSYTTMLRAASGWCSVQRTLTAKEAAACRLKMLDMPELNADMGLPLLCKFHAEH